MIADIVTVNPYIITLLIMPHLKSGEQFLMR